MQDLGLKKEQLQQHRLYQPTLEQGRTEAPSIMQLSGNATFSDASILPPAQRGRVSSPPCSPPIENSSKAQSMSQ